MQGKIGEAVKGLGEQAVAAVAEGAAKSVLDQAQQQAELLSTQDPARHDLFVPRRDVGEVECLLKALFVEANPASKLSVYAYLFSKNGHHFSVAMLSRGSRLELLLLRQFGFDIRSLQVVKGVFPVVATILALHYVKITRLFNDVNKKNIMTELDHFYSSLQRSQDLLTHSASCGSFCLDPYSQKLHKFTQYLSLVQQQLCSRSDFSMVNQVTLHAEEARRQLLQVMVDVLEEGELFSKPGVNTEILTTVGSLAVVKLPFSKLQDQYLTALAKQESYSKHISAMLALFTFSGIRKPVESNCLDDRRIGLLAGLAWFHGSRIQIAKQSLFSDSSADITSVGKPVLRRLKNKIQYFSELSLSLELLALLSKNPTAHTRYIRQIFSVMQRTCQNLEHAYPAPQVAELSETLTGEFKQTKRVSDQLSSVINLIKNVALELIDLCEPPLNNIAGPDEQTGGDDLTGDVIGVLLGASDPSDVLDDPHQNMLIVDILLVYLEDILKLFTQPLTHDLYELLSARDILRIKTICSACERFFVSATTTINQFRSNRTIPVADRHIENLNIIAGCLSSMVGVEVENSRASVDENGFSLFLLHCIQVLDCNQVVMPEQHELAPAPSASASTGVDSSRDAAFQLAAPPGRAALAGSAGAASGQQPSSLTVPLLPAEQRDIFTESNKQQQGNQLLPNQHTPDVAAKLQKLAMMEQQELQRAAAAGAKTSSSVREQKLSSAVTIDLRKHVEVCALLFQNMLRYPVRGGRQTKPDLFLAFRRVGYFAPSGEMRDKRCMVDRISDQKVSSSVREGYGF